MSVYKIKRKTGANTTEDIQLDYNTAIANKPTIPTNADYVDKTTTQTIGGTKTFSSSIVSTSGTPLLFEGIGSGTYNKGAFVCNATDGIGFEAPMTTDSASGTKLPITFSWRGGSSSMGGFKVESTGSYEKIGSGAWKKLATTDDMPDVSSYLPKSGGTMTGDIDWSSSNTSAWLKPYLLAFKNANTSASPTYPYTGFYQWGDEWQVNARDSNNTFVHNLLTINNSTKVATFSARPTVNGSNIALSSEVPSVWYGTQQQYDAITNKDSNTYYYIQEA